MSHGVIPWSTNFCLGYQIAPKVLLILLWTDRPVADVLTHIRPYTIFFAVDTLWLPCAAKQVWLLLESSDVWIPADYWGEICAYCRELHKLQARAQKACMFMYRATMVLAEVVQP